MAIHARLNESSSPTRVPGSLLCLTENKGFRSFINSESVGESFSIFTPVGLLPLAVVGVDIRVLLASTDVRERIVSRTELMYNPACLKAALQYFVCRKEKSIPVMMPYGDRLLDIANRYRQPRVKVLAKIHNEQ